MRFERNAPGGGVDAVCRLENGKAFLEWRLYLAEDGGEQNREAAGEQQNRDVARRRQGWKEAWMQQSREGDEKAAAQVRIFVTDEDSNVVLECRQQLKEEEPLQSILLQPRLWRGVEEPYLYHVEAILEDWDGCCRDRVRRWLGLRNLSCRQPGDLVLNGLELESRAVKYFLPDKDRAANGLWKMEKDMKLLLLLGANCICLEGAWDGENELYRGFLQLCDRFGFLAFGKKRGGSEYVWMQESDVGAGITQREVVKINGEAEMPILRGEKRNYTVDCGAEARALGERALGPRQRGQALLPDGEYPGPLFYQYLAKWGKQSFVHIVPESIMRMESGNYTALCYSNCDKVALYSDGILFEFQSGDGEFRFREIPAKTPCIMLAAEGDGCGESLSVHKSFVKRMGK